MVVMGIVWGLWHAPIIAMGHNYGTEYPGAPWTGILATIWIMFILGTFLGWAALRGGSVWPAVIGHGAFNGIAGIYVFFTQGSPNLYWVHRGGNHRFVGARGGCVDHLLEARCFKAL